MCCSVPSPDLSFQPDEHLEVYVSAYENPNHFWIQILGVRSLQLDKLTEEMNRFYNSSNPTVRMAPSADCTSVFSVPGLTVWGVGGIKRVMRLGVWGERDRCMLVF